MKSSDVRAKFIKYYESRGHKEIPSAPLVPENDPTTLFTGSGMQPMIPYLLGQAHPAGTRLVDSQKCLRAQDIEEVGDNRHTTCFEMLGNWSLGDYFKNEQIEWLFEFLTNSVIGIGLDPERLYVSVFRGKSEYQIPRDDEAVELWKNLFGAKGIDATVVDFAEKNGLQGGRIFVYDETKNWWSRSGPTGSMPVGEPGGPDSEVFYDFGAERKLHEQSPYKDTPCHVNCDCGRFLEICNSVFMTYKKTEKGFEFLAKKNIDFGGGLERMAAAVNSDPDVFKTGLFWPIIEKISKKLNVVYGENKLVTARLRVIADHIKAAIFLISDGVVPSNKQQGYVLRRLLRRASVKLELMQKGSMMYLSELIETVLHIYEGTNYFTGPMGNSSYIGTQVIESELNQFKNTLDKGFRIIEKIEQMTGSVAFDLYQTYGFPLEITEELFAEKGQVIDHDQFEKEFNKHKELSRSASKGMFKGGLADHSEQTTRLHTAHHLLLAALQKLVDPSIKQRGSNITAERLRIDFNFSRKLESAELEKVAALVNKKIKENLTMQRVEMAREVAEKIGAQMEFGHKYPDRVSVYIVGLSKDVNPEAAKPSDYFSAEFCGGPHVSFTGALGHFTITKEESAGSGIRRLYATLTAHA